MWQMKAQYDRNFAGLVPVSEIGQNVEEIPQAIVALALFVAWYETK